MIALILILFSSISFSQDFGDNSDGVCNFTGGAQAKSVWNCTDLFVSNTNTFPAASAVVLKVSGSVSIAGGGELSVSAIGQTAGAGAMSGGACSLSPSCSSPATDASNPSGVVSPGGNTASNGGFAASGGGGSGATYNSVSVGLNGAVGNDGGAGTPGTGGIANLVGYGSESNFATQMKGGSGGGAGGSGEDIIFYSGGAGGGGGGIIQIFSKGSIDINGSIVSNGADGLNGNANASAGGGGGGGGSGGSIFIYSQSTVSVTGNVQALGGSGGAGFSGDGAGGAGGKGRIRVDSFDGSVVGAANINPAPQVFTAAALPGIKAKFKSDISHNCSFKTDQVDFYPSFIFGILLSLLAMVVLKRI